MQTLDEILKEREKMDFEFSKQIENPIINKDSNVNPKFELLFDSKLLND